MYMPALRSGKRCVAIVEGFYEWKRDASSKQPYYIYSKQKDSVKFEDKTTWTNEWSEENGWQGFQVLKLAGIFNTFKTETVSSFNLIFSIFVIYNLICIYIFRKLIFSGRYCLQFFNANPRGE